VQEALSETRMAIWTNSNLTQTYIHSFIDTRAAFLMLNVFVFVCS